MHSLFNCGKHYAHNVIYYFWCSKHHAYTLFVIISIFMPFSAAATATKKENREKKGKNDRQNIKIAKIYHVYGKRAEIILA